MKARDIMTSTLEYVTREDSVQEAARRMRGHEFYRVARSLNERGVVGRFSTFLEHVKTLKTGIKKKNVTVWFVAFGTNLNPVMTACAGSGRYFKADNAAELDAIFSKIAASVGDLRISR